MGSSWISPIVSNPIGARVAFYPTVLWGVFLETVGWRPRYHRINSTVVLGGLPFRRTVKMLTEEENISGVLIMNEEYETQYLSFSEKDWQSMGLQAIRIPITDFNNAPSMQQIEKAVEFIESFKDKNESVYVHCKAGRGRSALVVMCYLMQSHDMLPENAYKYVKEKRPHILLGERQWQSVKDYYSFMKNR